MTKFEDMPNLTVAVLGPAGFAKDLGKTGTVSDITLYNLKQGDTSVTFIEPTRYPEKIAPLSPIHPQTPPARGSSRASPC